jgi:CRP/FNR family transcriptional activator FtrB
LFRLAFESHDGRDQDAAVQRWWFLTEAHKEAAQGNIVVPFDRSTMASHLGTTRENLSRSLALLTEHGVRIRGREIVIDSQDQLEAFARPQRFIDDPTS